MERSLVAEIPLEAEDLTKVANDVFSASEAKKPIQSPAIAERRLGYRFVKRAFDIVFSLGVITVGLAPIALLCLIIRLSVESVVDASEEGRYDEREHAYDRL